MKKQKKAISRRVIALSLAVLLLFVPFSSNLGKKVDVKADDVTDAGGDTTAPGGDTEENTDAVSVNYEAAYTIQDTAKSILIGEGDTATEYFALEKHDDTYTMHSLSDRVEVLVAPNVQWKEGGLEFKVEEKGGTIATTDISIPGWDNWYSCSAQVPIQSITPIYKVTYKITGGFYPYSDTTPKEYLTAFADSTQLIDIGTNFSMDATNSKYALYLKAEVVSTELTGAECIPQDSGHYSTGNTEANGEQDVVKNAIATNSDIQKFDETWKNTVNAKAAYSLQRKYEYSLEDFGPCVLEGKEGIDTDNDSINDTFKKAELTLAYENYKNTTYDKDTYIGEVKYSVLSSGIELQTPEFTNWGYEEFNRVIKESGYCYGGMAYFVNDTLISKIVSDQVEVDVDPPSIDLKGLYKLEDDGSTWTPIESSDGYKVTEEQAKNGMYRYAVCVTDASLVESVKCGKLNSWMHDSLNYDTNGDMKLGPDVYYYTIKEGDIPDNDNDEFKLYVYAKDVLGNTTGEWDNRLSPTIKRFNGELMVSAEFYVGETKTIDFPSNSNQQVKIKVNATSGYPIYEFTVIDKRSDGKIIKLNHASAPDFDASSSEISDGYATVHSANYEFSLPAELINQKLDDIVVQVVAGEWEENPDSEDGVLFTNKQTKEISLGKFVYDATKPTYEIVNEPDNEKWYTSYILEGKICSGLCDSEDDLEYAGYYMKADGSEVGNSDNMTSILAENENVASKDFSIKVAESTSSGGTKVVFAAKDKSGNELEPKATYICVDNTRPEIDANEMYVRLSATDGKKVGSDGKLEGGGEFAGNPVISVTAKDNLTLAKVKYQVIYNGNGSEETVQLESDTSNNKVIDYQIPVEENTGLVRDGKYEVLVSVYDKAGNASDTRRIAFSVDNTPPVFSAKIASGTQGGKSPRSDGTDWYYNSGTVYVTLSVDDDNIDTNAITVRDGETTIDPPTWVNGSTTIPVTGDGTHTITITGKDKAGNEGVPQSVSFIMDSTAPNVSMNLNGSDYSEARGRINSTTDVTLRFNVDDANRDGDDYYCAVVHKVPGQADSERTYMPTSETTYTFSEDGDYIVSFYATDMANNSSGVRTAQFRIDKNAPQLQILGASGSVTSDTTITFVMNETMWQDASGEATIYRKAGDGREELVYKTIQLTPTSADTRISEVIRETGTYRIEMSAKDQIGHTTSLNQTFTMDKNAPVVSMTGVNNYDKIDGAIEFYVEVNEEFFVNKTVSVTGTRTDIDGKVENLEYSNEIVQGANPTIFRKTFDRDGIYDLKVLARDPSGNERTDSVHFVIDTKAPVIGDLSDYEDKTLREFNWDIDLDELVSDLTVCDTHMYLNGSEYDGSSDIEDGVYTLLIVAEDELGHKTEKSINFTLDTKAPVFIVTGVENGQIKNEAYSIDVSLQLDEDILEEVQLNGSPVTISEGNTAHINVTSEGKYELTMKAVDQAGNEANQLISFAYGVEKKAGSNWWIIVVACVGGLAVFGGFIALIKRRRDSQ